MPRGDGTGPLGQGPMTGRAAGYCAGYDRPGYANPNIRGYGLGMAYRRGFGWGGRGRGFGRGFFAPYPYYEPAQPVNTKAGLENAKSALESEKKAIEAELQQIERRLDELSKKGK